MQLNGIDVVMRGFRHEDYAVAVSFDLEHAEAMGPFFTATRKGIGLRDEQRRLITTRRNEFNPVSKSLSIAGLMDRTKLRTCGKHGLRPT